MSAISEIDSERISLEIFETFEDDEKRLVDRAFQAITSAVTLLLDHTLPRNPVNGNRELRIFSLNQEIIIGKKAFANMTRAFGGEINHPETEMCQKILSEIAAYSKRNFEYKVIVVNSDIVKVFCAPGGQIGITKGFLEKTERYVNGKIGKDLIGYVNPETGKTISYEGVTREDVIAAVLGHEMIRVDARHGMAIYEFFLIVVPSLLARLLFENIFSYSVGIFPAIFCAQIRNQELEADKFGMVNAREAGYNPIGALVLQEVLKGDELPRGLFFDLLRISPLREERQRLLFQEINAHALKI